MGGMFLLRGLSVRWLVLYLFFAKFALAEESILMDKKSIINQINTNAQTQNGKEISSEQKIKKSEKFIALYNRKRWPRLVGQNI